MIFDYRIYCTLYALLVPAYFGVCFYGMATVGNSVAQTRAETLWRFAGASLAFVAVGNFLDWLWS